MPKVLIDDDSLTVRKVVERILESRQMQVRQASLGTEAIERIQHDEPDIVLCDVLLPDKEGYEVCRFVKSHPRLDRTPVLLISGIVNPAVLDRAVEVGSAGVMRKPFSAEELTGKVIDLLGLGVAASPPAGGNGVPGLAGATAPPPLAAVARPPSPVALPAPATPPKWSAPPPPTLEGCLAGLAAAEGVHAVVLVDRGGRLIGSAGNANDAATLGALAACLVSAADEAGEELGRGSLQGLILEQGQGLLLLSAVGEAAVLALVLDDPAALGKTRYYVKRA